MAKTYTARINATAWKEHTCVQCGGVYTYFMKRVVTGQAANAERAQEIARNNVVPMLNRSVDVQPCPTCGLIQPDMVGQNRAVRHKWIFLAALIVFAVLIILRPSYAVQANTLTFVSLAACLFFVIWHLSVDLKNPNGDPEANRRLAAERVSAGQVQFAPGRPGPARREFVSPQRGIFHTTAIAMMLASLAMVAAPEVVRSVKGWPANADIYPPVAGPGDDVRIYMKDSISSIKGYWRASPDVTITAAGKPVKASASTNQNDWGNSISYKSSEKSSSSTPWVKVVLPSDPALAGQKIHCDLTLALEYPQERQSGVFRTVETMMNRGVDVQLGPAGSGSQYDGLWWLGTAGGMGLILLGGQILRGSARGFQSRALPTRIFPPESGPPVTAMPPAIPAMPGARPPPLR